MSLLLPAIATAAPYTVQTGDSLSKIASGKGMNWQQIWKSNPNIQNPNLIYSGQTIEVPDGSTSAAPAPVAPVVQPVAAVTGGCDWLAGQLAANGVSAGDIGAAVAIASKESGCRTTAVNASSGACNVFQELPCGKWGGSTDLSGHIRGADGYAKARYGGWNGAWAAWQSKSWW